MRLPGVRQVLRADPRSHGVSPPGDGREEAHREGGLLGLAPAGRRGRPALQGPAARGVARPTREDRVHAMPRRAVEPEEHELVEGAGHPRLRAAPEQGSAGAAPVAEVQRHRREAPRARGAAPRQQRVLVMGGCLFI